MYRSHFMNRSKARKYLGSFFDLYTYDIKKNLAARWGLVWSIVFITVSFIAHYLHDYTTLYPDMHAIHWLVSLGPIIFFPLVGATGTLELKENYETATQLTLSKIRYRTLVENLPDIVYSSSPNNRFDIKFISSHIKSLSGYDTEEFYASTEIFQQMIHSDDREIIFDKSKVITKSMTLQYRIIHKDTKELHYVIDHSIPVKEDNKIIAIEGIIVDITTEVKAKQRLSALTRELINMQENERQRIAKELHDEVGQALSAIKINLNLMNKKLRPDSLDIRRTITKTDQIVNNLIIDLKRIALDLRPSMLDHLGLEATLHAYIKEFKSRTKLDVAYDISMLNKRLPIDIEITLYRIIQEALTNIVKHSSANKIGIDIKEQKERINIIIQDNGQGFSVDKAFNPETRGISFGIIGMQERVKNLGGDFEISSEKGKGTKLSLYVPISL